MLSSRQQGKRRTRDCLKGEGGRLRAIVEWKCVNCLHWWYFCLAFVRQTILRQLSARSLETFLGACICLNIVPESHSEPQKYPRGHVSHSILYTLVCQVLCHGKTGMGICL